WRAVHVVDLPAREVRAGDIPALARPVGREHERALARPDQHSHLAHGFAPWRRPPLSNSRSSQRRITVVPLPRPANTVFRADRSPRDRRSIIVDPGDPPAAPAARSDGPGGMPA